MLDKAKAKFKAISEKLLSFVTGGTGMTQEVRRRKNTEYRKREKPAEAKKHRY